MNLSVLTKHYAIKNCGQDVYNSNVNKLTLQSDPRCTVQTLNSSQAAGLGAPYSRECICGERNWHIKVLALVLRTSRSVASAEPAARWAS
jgi:hypothetical protein